MQTIIYILPELFLSLAIMSILMVGVFIKKSFKLVNLLTILSLILAIILLLNQPSEIIKIFNESFYVKFINIPTTLLSQVDSSIGGKTGVNSKKYGKNLIGTFYQPNLVLIDIATIQSLPRREIVCGYAEILKHAIISNKKNFNWLNREGNKIINRLDPSTTSERSRWDYATLDSNRLGLFYSAFTYFLGFKVNEGEYKLMGLSAYGKPKYSELILEKLIDVKDDTRSSVQSVPIKFIFEAILIGKLSFVETDE